MLFFGHQLVANIEGYLFEAGGDYASVFPEASTSLAIQDADLDINYYEEYFARRVHHNYVTNDEGGKGNVILSMVQCEDDCVRILLRTFDVTIYFFHFIFHCFIFIFQDFVLILVFAIFLGRCSFEKHSSCKDSRNVEKHPLLVSQLGQCQVDPSQGFGY
jgi:hypothetical protein